MCSACHAKKVICDLQSKTSDGLSQCSNCYSAGTECQIRPSKRKKTSTSPWQAHAPRPSLASNDSIRVRDTDQDRDGRHQSKSFSPIPPPPPPIPGPSSVTVQLPLPTSQTTVAQVPSITPQSQHSKLLVSAATGRSNPSDIDTGFLYVFGPETHADAEQQELEATLEYGYSFSDARQQELQQIYADTYMEFCYAWCPVLDVPEVDTLRSPLLANALAVGREPHSSAPDSTRWTGGVLQAGDMHLLQR